MRIQAFAVSSLVAVILTMGPKAGTTWDPSLALSAIASASYHTAQTRSPCNSDDPPPWCKKAGSSGRT